MSVGFTALACGIDLYSYFTDMIENHSKVFQNPEKWLPWVWKENNSYRPWREQKNNDLHWEDITEQRLYKNKGDPVLFRKAKKELQSPSKKVA